MSGAVHSHCMTSGAVCSRMDPRRRSCRRIFGPKSARYGSSTDASGRREAGRVRIDLAACAAPHATRNGHYVRRRGVPARRMRRPAECAASRASGLVSRGPVRLKPPGSPCVTWASPELRTIQRSVALRRPCGGPPTRCRLYAPAAVMYAPRLAISCADRRFHCCNTRSG